MNNCRARLGVMAVAIGLALGVGSSSGSAQEPVGRDQATRLDQMEREIHLMNERMERMTERGGPALEQRAQSPRGPDGDRPVNAPPAMKVRWHGEQAGMVFWRVVRCLRAVMFVLFLVHILLAIWVYTDIRKRGEGHGIFIVLVLLAGIPAAILYAVVRIGDRKAGPA